jgi:hypothetical protein
MADFRGRIGGEMCELPHTRALLSSIVTLLLHLAVTCVTAFFLSSLYDPRSNDIDQEGGDMSGIAFGIAVLLAVTSALGVPLPLSGIYRHAPKGLAGAAAQFGAQEVPASLRH